METTYRSPAKVVDHLEESLRMLQGRGYQQLQLLASYPSYMTGLMFHKYEEKPEDHKVYVCLPEPNNPHDPHAMGIISSRNKRIAFVPRVLTEHFYSAFPGLFSGTCVLAAYCIGFCTPKSAQCLYNVYQVVGATPMFSMAPPPSTPAAPTVPCTMHVPCTMCRGPANRFIIPCRHYACCTNCTAQLIGRACPSCQSIVTGTFAV